MLKNRECPRCKVELRLGRAIKALSSDYENCRDGPLQGGFSGGYKHVDDGTKLINVMKCPECGYSEFKEQGDK